MAGTIYRFARTDQSVFDWWVPMVDTSRTTAPARRSPAKMERRASILAAGRVVFARDGFARALMEDVARRAQVGKGTIYEHFGSKDGLFLAVCADVIEQNVRKVRKGIPEGGNARTRLERLLRGLVAGIEDVVDLCGLYFEAWNLAWTRSDLRGRLVESFRGLYRPIRDQVAALVREGRKDGTIAKHPPDDVATLLLALLDGLAYQSLFLFDRRDLPRLARRASDLFFLGLEPRA